MTTKNNNELIEAKLEIFKESFNDKMNTVIGQLERIDTRMDESEVVHARNSQILEEHVRRTEALEKKLEQDKQLLEKKIDEEIKKVEKDLAPIVEQSGQMKLVTKIVIALVVSGGLGSAGLGVKKLLESLLGGE